MSADGAATRNPQPRSGGAAGRVTTVFLSTVIAVAVIGYFVGITDGVPRPDDIPDPILHTRELSTKVRQNPKLVPAVSYAEVPLTAMGPTDSRQAAFSKLPEQQYDLFAEIEPSAEEKQRSSEIRSSRRAFNGAPPVIPHAVQNTSDGACFACHGGGVQLAGMKASVMSHQYLANCTQCHAPPPPEPFNDVSLAVDSNFIGLPAPSEGKRAYPGAPPTIPHSQWMRENCTACHGGPNGWKGMETTHPWRTNCTQCHAPSAALDQVFAVGEVPMLSPIRPAQTSAE